MKISYLIPREEEFSSLEHLYLVYPSAVITSVDGVEVIGDCFLCGGIILESEDYVIVGDETTHLACEKEDKGAFHC